MMAASTGVLVLGMHRSGTSALTRVLSLMGAELGTQLKAAGPDNPLGFWEHEAVVAVHEKLLLALNRAWDDVRPLPDAWRDMPAAREAADALASVIRQDFSQHSIWAIKDPRTCRFLPLWCDVMREVGVEPRAIIVHREPVEVARSLQLRNGLPRAVGQLLWARYMVDAEVGSRTMIRSLVDYGDLLADWHSAMARVCHDLGISLNADSGVAARIDAFLSSSLRHHVRTCDEETLSGVADLAEAYSQAARHPWALGAVGQAAKELDVALEPVFPLVDGLSEQVVEERKRAAVLARDLQETAAALSSATKWGAERDQDLQATAARVETLRVELAQATEWGSSRDEELRATIARGEALRAELARATEWGSSRDEELRAAIDRFETLRAELARATEWGADRDKALSAALARSEMLQGELAKATEWGTDIDRALQQAGERLHALQGQLSESTQWGASRDRALQEATARIRDLEAERAALERQMAQMNEHFESEVRLLRNRADHADAALASNRRDVDSLERQTNEVIARLAALEHQIHQGGPRRAALRVARRLMTATKARAKTLAVKAIQVWPGSPETKHARMERARAINQVRRTGLSGRAVLDDLHALARARWPAELPYRMRTGEPERPLLLDISVVVYESERWVAGFMASLVQVDYPLDQIQLHVRDHSRGDGSQQAFADFFRQAGCVLGGYHYSRGANKGFGAGHNHNFRQAQADHFLVINVDGRFEPDTLRNLVRAVNTSRAEIAAWELRQVPYEHPKYYDPVTMLTSWVSGACVLFRRDAFAAVRGFDEAIFMYGEDVDLSYRLRAAGYALAYVPHAVFHHDSYTEPEQFKPLQFHGSALANSLLRLRFGRLQDIAALPGMWQELRASSQNLGQMEGYRRNIRKLVALAPRFLMSRLSQRRIDVPFARWDYGLRRDGAFEFISTERKKSPLVSIIVRTYPGRQAVLRQALATIANQTYANVEAVVVEDRGDTLGSAVAAMAGEFGIPVVYHACLEPESNRCFTGNRGLQAASGEYLNFLDDDDLLFADHVEYLVSRMQACPEAAACYALSWEAAWVADPADATVLWEVMHSAWPGHKREFDREVLAQFNYMPIQAVLFRRELYERYGGMDERLENLEDWEMWRRYSLAHDFRYAPKTTSVYHVPGDPAARTKRQAVLDEYLPTARAIADEARGRFGPYVDGTDPGQASTLLT